MDQRQLQTFLAPLLDTRVVGISEGSEIYGGPVCPELFSFIVGRLWEAMPDSSWLALPLRTSQVGLRADVKEKCRMQALALATLLREVADGIDPTKGEP